MTESRDDTAAVASSRCPWCSASVPAQIATCPSCGAKLRDEADADIPGVTQIDPAASVARATPRARGLLGWLSGDYESTATDSDRAGVELPSDAVKQEMFRIEMEALRAELDAEAAEREAADREASRGALIPAALAAPPSAPAVAAPVTPAGDDSAPGDGTTAS